MSMRAIVTFGPSADQGRLDLIFPLSGGSQLAVKPAGHWDNWGRLAPPELDKTGRTGSWELWLVKRQDLGSERKRRLLHTYFRQKMTSECTIFPYGIKQCFSRKSTSRGHQIRRPHSSL